MFDLVEEVVYLGSDNGFKMGFKKKDELGVITNYDFSVYAKMSVELVGSGVAPIVDTALNGSGIIDATPGNGILIFYLGKEAIPAGRYFVRLNCFTTVGDAYPTTILHEAHPDVRLRLTVA